MRHLPKQTDDPNLLVGLETSDDAGAYRLTDDLAMIQTVDYFTPVVDDPYMFGQIAAANALSDVYAMGAKPTTVLNIVGFPIKKLPPEMLADILRGAADKVKEAGAVIVGGHSIDDQEPKFGLSVTGLAHPDRIFKNVGAKPGDVLVLTKPIGVGILTTGIKREAVTKEQEEAVTRTMAALNKEAAEALEGLNPHAVTDVTGFGLLGHSLEMAKGSEVSFEIQASSVPMLEGTKELARQGIIPGGSKANERWIASDVEYQSSITEVEKSILCDAITSGGLLVSLTEEEAQQYVEDMHKRGLTASIIGRVSDKSDYPLYVQS
ncbi:segregation protein B [Alkalihalophilus marmarensis DSM 21297]|uniref:Selenide, water dikinase n=1 Tax=Alkalihalophilus marmarensis DSM 21297 TaxID=1188261 RepID=U6SNY6_9BACI|nr:segregation protein B [Alkalihalophilus marmarensis DSM 21297]